MRCPDCGAHLTGVAHHGVAVEECPAGHGMWLTEVEIHTIANRERHSWIARYFYGSPVGSRASAGRSEST
jgi:Zn-finger nucleic acid-binding protein